MSPRQMRKLATRAVEAWLRRMVESRRDDHAVARSGSPFLKELEERRGVLRDALIRALTEAGIDDGLVTDAERGTRFLARRLESRLDAVMRRADQLERVASRSTRTWRRHRRLVTGVRSLTDPDSPALATLHQEICLVISLAGARQVNWARQR